MSRTQLSLRIQSNLNIPTIPEVVQRIQRLVKNPDTGTKEIGEVIAQDPELSAKLLRIANSAFYGLGTPCLSAKQASTVLGMRVLQSIVSQVAVLDLFEGLDGDGRFDVRTLWEHSIRTAHVCAFLHDKATVPSSSESDELYMCGLLHDIGKTVLLAQMTDEYLDVILVAQKLNAPSWRLEQQRLGFTHTEVGGVLASHWGLPDVLVNAITGHHDRKATILDQPATLVVSCADQLVHCVAKEQWAAANAIFDKPVMDKLGLGESSVAEITDYARDLQVEL